jgi:hypothetical protein
MSNLPWMMVHQSLLLQLAEIWRNHSGSFSTYSGMLLPLFWLYGPFILAFGSI